MLRLLSSAESQLQDVCVFESSLRKVVSRLQSYETSLEEQSELEAQCGGRIRDLLHRKSEANRKI